MAALRRPPGGCLARRCPNPTIRPRLTPDVTADPFDLSDDDAALGPAGAPAPQDGAVRPLPGGAEPAYLSILNPEQRRAVECIDGPLLVLAGAGTGKTRVLTTRLAHILSTGRAWPSQVLAVTFTNKAAREMRERVAGLMGRAAEGMWLGTFHAIGARMLRRHAEVVGLRSDFTILDTDDQLRLLKQLLQASNIDEKKFPPRAFAAVIGRWKDRGLAPTAVPAGDSGLADGRAVEIYRQYQDRLATLNACDFGDLLLHNLTIFQSQPEVLADYHRRFRYILVDEYQDTNVAQYLWLRLLAQANRNICCVGDDDQSIYGWRGAEVGNILRFESDFPGAEVVRLERNYRSTSHILAAASGVIAHNEGRLGKTLWTEGEAGEKVAVRGVWDQDEEARAVGEEIEALQRDGRSLAQMAILVRAGSQTRAFEERFIQMGLRYRVIGGLRFYERQEIRDAMAYLRVIAQEDDDLALERILNVPKRGLGDATVQLLHQAARAKGTSLMKAARHLAETDELRPRVRTTVRGLIADFDRWRAMLDGLSHAEVVETVLDESGYTEMWQNDRSPDAPGRLENLKELVQAIDEFDSLTAFLEHVSLVMDNDQDETNEMVNVMTLHAAKGLEFDTVFLPGWEDGLFPSQRALDESGVAGLEEERRLAYVGITRARQRCYIFFAANRRVYGQWQSNIPSRFVDELPEDHVARDAQKGVYGSRAAGINEELYGGFVYEAPWLDAERRAASRKGGGRPEGSGRGRPEMIEASAEHVRIDDGPAAYRVGSRVFHQKFGYGKVAGIDDNKLTIDFDKAGRKRVMDSFVQPA